MKIYYCRLFLSLAVISLAAGNVHAVPSGGRITYGGKDAGAVVFDGSVHAARGLSCSDCHEEHGFESALFEMNKGASIISMRKMEMGRSCGRCHEVSMTEMSSCSKCHRK